MYKINKKREEREIIKNSPNPKLKGEEKRVKPIAIKKERINSYKLKK